MILCEIIETVKNPEIFVLFSIVLYSYKSEKITYLTAHISTSYFAVENLKNGLKIDKIFRAARAEHKKTRPKTIKTEIEIYKYVYLLFLKNVN